MNDKPKVTTIDTETKFGIEFETDSGIKYQSWMFGGYDIPIFFIWHNRKWMITSNYFSDLEQWKMTHIAIELIA